MKLFYQQPPKGYPDEFYKGWDTITTKYNRMAINLLILAGFLIILGVLAFVFR